MFTGLVETTAPVVAIKEHAEKKLVEISIKKPNFFDDLEQGYSVAHNGVCLTITNKNPQVEDLLTYDLGFETLKVTNFENLKVGDLLNLERPLKVGDRLHGHLVTGHVDEVCKISHRSEIEGGCLLLEISDFKRPDLIWKKGSIVINGVSLTINEADKSKFSVCLIPETLEKTNLSNLVSGSLVNIEYDFWAKGVIHAAKIKES